MRGEVSASITPLCPAGHLPLKGEIGRRRDHRFIRKH